VEVQTYRALEFPLDTPVNSYLIPSLGILIDAGINPPKSGYEYVYMTHWHWDHVLGISRMRSKTLCMPRKTLEILENRSYADRFALILKAGGIKLSTMENIFIQEMDRRYKTVIESLSLNNVLPVDECPHVVEGTVRLLECPGHSVDHVCYIIGDSAFVGDTLLPGARSTIIDFQAHRTSIIALLAEEWRTLYPGHGDPVGRRDAGELSKRYVVERCRRVYSILSALANMGGEAGLDDLLRKVYNVEPSLRSFVALRTLVGYLAELERAGFVHVDRTESPWRVRLIGKG